MEEFGTSAAGRRCPSASHAERELAIGILKAAFVQGSLAREDLDARVGQALVAPTRADLTALTGDLPVAAPVASRGVPPHHARQNAAARRAVRSGAAAVAAVVIAVSAGAAAVGQPGAGALLAVFIVVLAAVATAFVAGLIAAALKLESRGRNRGPLPPRSLPRSWPGC